MATLSPSRGGVAAHHPLGMSTGMWAHARGDWPTLTALATAGSSFAIELGALDESELDGLLAFFETSGTQLAQRYISVHGPSKGRVRSERALAHALAGLPSWVDAVVLHPDTLRSPETYAVLGDRLVIENMDARKATGRTVAELAPLFARLPAAGFCLDVAHVASVDPTMALGDALLDAFGTRLRHLHVSSLDGSDRHVELRRSDEARFAGVLDRCIDVPWILEAPLPPR